jgi:mRNA interferase MazF
MVKGPRVYVPERGDIVHINFTPQAGREQYGKRPALILTPKAYNQKTSLAIMCPITSKKKGFPFEVFLRSSCKVKGVVLVDQVKSLDWKERGAEFWDRIEKSIFDEVLAKLSPLLNLP